TRAISALQIASSASAMLPPSPSCQLTSMVSSTFRADQAEEAKIYEDHEFEEDAPQDATPEIAGLRPLSRVYG
ncbi:hypothetical protein LTR37_008963, partial [Vermiconidia calcicola]